jgi:hypothetical protein
VKRVPHLNVVSVPGVAGVCDLAIGYSKDFKTACEALANITVVHTEKRDSAKAAQIMRDLAWEALKAVKFGPNR